MQPKVRDQVGLSNPSQPTGKMADMRHMSFLWTKAPFPIQLRCTWERRENKPHFQGDVIPASLPAGVQGTGVAASQAWIPRVSHSVRILPGFPVAPNIHKLRIPTNYFISRSNKHCSSPTRRVHSHLLHGPHGILQGWLHAESKHCLEPPIQRSLSCTQSKST